MKQNRYIQCVQLGFHKPTIVIYENEEFKTEGQSIGGMAAIWRDKWFPYEEDEWIVLGLDGVTYQAASQHPCNNEMYPSIIQEFHKHKVICINSDVVGGMYDD